MAPSSFSCSICLSDKPDRPVVTRCGHLFCSRCISRWMSTFRGTHSTCPNCEAYLIDSTSLTPIRGADDAEGCSNMQDSNARNAPRHPSVPSIAQASGVNFENEEAEESDETDEADIVACQCTDIPIPENINAESILHVTITTYVRGSMVRHFVSYSVRPSEG
ncbi:hypothetical protein KP509_32G073100 [Ceratopteris richardii]|uniref:RING-type E3 ubiquitin transferase n=1 Tax=Ceratopteris richardii TaxID=49495 RepID=A0A8T2QUH5_CERRI|nr:hypothetical protein KP509_32G073100 [Ceratopteris richardii]